MLKEILRTLILFCLVQNGFSAAVEDLEKVPYNLLGIKPYDGKSQKKFEREAGIENRFLASFKTPKKELCYVGVSHENSLEGDTFHLVKTTFDAFEPEILILEGFSYTYGRNPWFILDRIKEMTESTPHWPGGEPNFAAFLAQRKGIPFVGAEPTDKEICEQLMAKGYLNTDVAFFYFLRQTGEYYRSKELLSEEQLPVLFKRDMGVYQFHFFLQKVPSYEDYQSWLRQHCHRNICFKNIDQLSGELTAPKLDGKLFTHQISNEINAIRDAYILKVELNIAREFSKIMIVYGGAHYYSQEEILKRYFGEPTYRRSRTSRRFFGKKAPTAAQFFKTYPKTKISLV